MLRCNKNQDYFKCSLIDSIIYLAISNFHSKYNPKIVPKRNQIIKVC
jgi:hypothetical protein